MKNWARLLGGRTRLAIDLGTENTLIQAVGEQVQTWNEPSVIAYACPPDGPSIPWVAGHAARRMEGRSNESVRLVRPLVDGVIVDVSAAIDMLKTMLQTYERGLLDSVLISFPHATTAIEKLAFRDLARSLNPHRVILIKEPLAAALGSDLAVLGNDGHMIVDLGKGIVEAVVIAQGEVIASSAMRLQGRTENERLEHYLKDRYGLLVGHDQLDYLKCSLHLDTPDAEREVKGLSHLRGLPERITVRVGECLAILEPYVQDVASCILETLEHTPLELLGDIMDQGIRLTGGGSLSQHVWRRLEQNLRMKMIRVPDPLAAVARGNHRILDDRQLQKNLGS